LFDKSVFADEVPIGLAFDIFWSENEIDVCGALMNVLSLHHKHRIEVDREFRRVRIKCIYSLYPDDVDRSFGKFVEILQRPRVT